MDILSKSEEKCKRKYKKRARKYSDSFIEGVLEYAKTHSYIETSRKFGISKNIITTWKGGPKIPMPKELRAAHYKETERTRRQNPEIKKHYKATNDEWRKKNKTRARELGRKSDARHILNRMHSRLKTRQNDLPISVTSWDLWRIAKKQKLICPITGLKLTNKTISLDHVLALSKGGDHSFENLRFVHKLANCMKYDRSDKELIDFCKQICGAGEYKNYAPFGGIQPLKMRIHNLNKRFAKKIKGEAFYELKPFDLWKILKRQKLICPITSIKLTLDNLSYDHIIPVSKGGSNEPSNLRAVHIWANKMRLNLDWKEIKDMAEAIVAYNS